MKEGRYYACGGVLVLLAGGTFLLPSGGTFLLPIVIVGGASSAVVRLRRGPRGLYLRAASSSIPCLHYIYMFMWRGGGGKVNL
jgi:hypothetical protein